MFNKPTIKAFTVIELLVSMTLTGILVAFAFMGYNQMQKLFIDYNHQSSFISEYNQLQMALVNIGQKASAVEQKNNNELVFVNDSTSVKLQLLDKVTLLSFKDHSDTFHFGIQKPEIILLNTGNSNLSLVNSFNGPVFFKSQKFTVSFGKEYDAQSILKYTLELNPPDELH